MSLKIRLSRAGAKKRPFYHMVVADARMPRDGRYLERVGSYNPMVAKDHEQRVTVRQDRLQYWLGVGAQPTDKVARLISALGLVEKPAIPTQTKKDKPRPKTVERMKAQEEAAQAAAEKAASEKAASEKAAAESAAAAPAEEAPAEAAPTEEAPAEEPKAEG